MVEDCDEVADRVEGCADRGGCQNCDGSWCRGCGVEQSWGKVYISHEVQKNMELI